ncbi:MAG: extracellular solute-binding protein, partial [Clostridia bacterium]|nr:extracellular solute-binding protein [Clostridia bacterium]
MKKILALVLGILMVLSVFAGCAQQPAETPAEPSEPADTSAPAETPEEPVEERKPQKLVYWYCRSEGAGEAIEASVEEFNETVGKELNIEVEAIYQGSAADATTKMRAVLSGEDASQLPDVMEIDATGILDYRNSGYAFTVDQALALDPEYDISQISPAALKHWNYSGTQWGLPITITTHVLFYNKTMFDAAGITAAPTTFEEIKGVAAALPATNANGQELKAYGCLPSSIYLAYWFGQIPGEEYGASYVVNNRN